MQFGYAPLLAVLLLAAMLPLAAALAIVIVARFGKTDVQHAAQALGVVLQAVPRRQSRSTR
jgi:hypothetical protein